MNYYIQAQITNMVAMAKTFEASCKMAALKDNGELDKAEEKQLKKISAITQKYIKELEALKPEGIRREGYVCIEDRSGNP